MATNRAKARERFTSLKNEFAVIEASKSTDARLKAINLIDIANRIMGVVEVEIDEKGEKVEKTITNGLLNVPGAVQLLDKVRFELHEVLNTDTKWQTKDFYQNDYNRIDKRVDTLQKCTDIPPEGRFIQNIG